MISASDTALLLALLLSRSGQKRARISDKTMRKLSKRKKLRSVFIREVTEKFADLGGILIELNRGGYGVIMSSTLEGAPAVKAGDHISKEIANAFAGTLKRGAIESELGLNAEEEDEA